MIKKYSIVLLVLMLLSSCSNTYNEQQKIKDLKWYKKDIKTFEVNIDQDGVYDLYFTMRHTTGYPFTSIKINIEQITPNNKELVKEAEFSVLDENGKYIGDVSGELWDIEEVFSENTKLKKGKYIFKFNHIMNHNPVVLVVDVGLLIKKVKEQKKSS